MSASLETYLVKLYLDRDARQAFVADQRAAASEAGLAGADVAQPRRSLLVRLLGLIRRPR